MCGSCSMRPAPWPIACGPTSGPGALILHTYRLGPHSKGDDTRDAGEIREAWTREPLGIIGPLLPAGRAAAIDREVDALVKRARERALDVAELTA